MATTHQVSCDCGFTGTYTTRAKADAALRQHSCRRWKQITAARARGEAARAQIDRSPQPCRHKQADHRHGTYACYTLDRCRCPPCTRARSEREQWRTRQQAYGRYHRYTDAGPVRDHVRDLMAAGMGLKRVAAVAGLEHSVLWGLVYGKQGRPPARRVHTTTASKIMTVELDLADGALDPDGTPTARRQLQALVTVGWSMSKVGHRLGIGVANLSAILRDGRMLRAGTVRTINAVYQDMSHQSPPESEHRDKIAARRARHYATARGWLTPLELELDDDTGDGYDDTGDGYDDTGDGYDGADPDDGGPVIDQVAIRRRMAGDHAVPLTRPERGLMRQWNRTEHAPAST